MMATAFMGYVLPWGQMSFGVQLLLLDCSEPFPHWRCTSNPLLGGPALIMQL